MHACRLAGGGQHPPVPGSPHLTSSIASSTMSRVGTSGSRMRSQKLPSRPVHEIQSPAWDTNCSSPSSMRVTADPGVSTS